MAVNLTMQSTAGTWPGGSFQLGPVQINSSFASLQTNALTFSGATTNSVTGPAGANGILIEAPTSNLVQLTLKGIAGDTGVPFLNIFAAQLFNPSGTTTIALTSAGAISGAVTVSWF